MRFCHDSRVVDQGIETHVGDGRDTLRARLIVLSRAERSQVSNPSFPFIADIDSGDYVGDEKVLPVVLLGVGNLVKGVMGLRVPIFGTPRTLEHLVQPNSHALPVTVDHLGNWIKRSAHRLAPTLPR